MRPDAVPLHEVSTIETPEQIELHLPLAGVGTRALAYIIDLLWQTVPIVAAAFLALAFLPADVHPTEFLEKGSDGQPHVPLLAIAFVSAVVFFVNFGYFALFEVLWNGQSPGKRSLGLRVVRDGGFPIDGRSALIRNLLRAVDFLPAVYFVGIASLFAGRAGKRIGDYAAGTFVVKELKPESGIVKDPTQRNSGPLSSAERSLVLDFLDRRWDLPDEARLRVARELSSRLAARLGQAVPMDPERFLEDIPRDGHT
jgi:uncharacterized RDD family membrane protein YckC